MLRVGEGEPLQERQDWKLLIKLKVGQYLEVDNREQWSLAQRRAHDLAARYGKRFTTKWLDKENVGRIWRIE